MDFNLSTSVRLSHVCTELKWFKIHVLGPIKIFVRVTFLLCHGGLP